VLVVVARLSVAAELLIDVVSLHTERGQAPKGEEGYDGIKLECSQGASKSIDMTRRA
jgi:hypothetical protein